MFSMSTNGQTVWAWFTILSYHFPRRVILDVCTMCSGPSKQRVANGCTMVHAVLTAVLEWANYQPVILASVDCLRIMLHYLNTGVLHAS